ncbi:MAG: zf-HC2 domain-containing protein [Blastocatellia bacterium]|nr:zf-HC2 domain-containing protein [Blastocatellia bacterium]
MTTENNICQSDQIAAFVDDELEPAQRLAFEQHVGGCDSCAAELRAQRTFMCELDTALAGRFDLEVPPDFAKVVAVHAENDMRGVRDRAEHRKALRYCIVLGLVAFALLGVATSRAVIATVQLFFRAAFEIISLLGKTVYGALAGFSVLARMFRRGLIGDAGLVDLAALLLFAFAIGLLTLLISRYHRTRVLD